MNLSASLFRSVVVGVLDEIDTPMTFAFLCFSFEYE